VFGVDPKAFVPTLANILPLVHEKDRERVRNTTINIQCGVKPLPLECRIVRPDGPVRLIRREAEVTYDEAGLPARRFVSARDIKEQHAPENTTATSRPSCCMRRSSRCWARWRQRCARSQQYPGSSRRADQLTMKHPRCPRDSAKSTKSIQTPPRFDTSKYFTIAWIYFS
jgi:hypothetical protein